MNLKNNIITFLDFAKEVEGDLSVARAKLDYEIKSGKRQDMTTTELDDAYAFISDNTNIVMDARRSGDWTLADELIEVW